MSDKSANHAAGQQIPCVARNDNSERGANFPQALARVEEPERSVAGFKRLSGQGNSRGWRFNRYEIHDRS